jgi:epoxyqueuosine reductase QueG
MDETEFDGRFAGTPVRRTKHAGMIRNAGIARRNLAGEKNESDQAAVSTDPES